jgi:hypothetical protein
MLITSASLHSSNRRWPSPKANLSTSEKLLKALIFLPSLILKYQTKILRASFLQKFLQKTRKR